ncbi:hypothetical protein FACS1894159_02630 [Bacteroidia bacterium]|nr:hypothetical protein FACS1894159_02630 [Bacteroidia bacterium]
MRRLNLLLLTTFALSLLSASGASGAARNSKPKEQKRSELHATLTAKYGLTQQQLQQFDRFFAEQARAFREINRTVTSPKERKAKTDAVRRQFKQNVSTVLTPEQFALWTKNRGTVATAGKKAHDNEKTRIRAIKNSDIPQGRKIELVDAAKKARRDELAKVVGEQRSSTMYKNRMAKNRMISKQNRQLHLTYEQSRRMNVITDLHQKQLKELAARQLPGKQAAQEQKKINTAHKDRVRNLLGEQRYALWERKQAGNFDRRMKGLYGMSPEQIKRYKELQNARAIERYKVVHSKLPQPERKARIEQIDARYQTRFREVLSPDQARKMEANRNYRAQKAARTAAAAPTPAAAKTPASLPAKNSAPTGSTAPAKTPAVQSSTKK